MKKVKEKKLEVKQEAVKQKFGRKISDLDSDKSESKENEISCNPVEEEEVKFSKHIGH